MTPAEDNKSGSEAWPALPLAAWDDTRATVHRWAQVLGKAQLALTPVTNHWWNVPLRVTARGIATELMDAGERWLDMELDFLDDVLRIRISDGSVSTVRLAARPVADFYAETVEALRRAGIACPIWPVPVEIEDRVRFDRDTGHHAYDKRYVLAFWRILAKTTALLMKFRGHYIGKSSPVQLYWGHLDLALSLFSGRPSPYTFADPIEREAYSHEVFAVGWWPGDSRLPKPAFYSYIAPEPAGFAQAKLKTPHAYYNAALHGFYLDYDDVRTAPDPEALVRDFFDTTYATAASLAGWDRAALERRTAAG